MEIPALAAAVQTSAVQPGGSEIFSRDELDGGDGIAMSHDPVMSTL
jgi:hypothetical protein